MNRPKYLGTFQNYRCCLGGAVTKPLPLSLPLVAYLEYRLSTRNSKGIPRVLGQGTFETFLRPPPSQIK